MSQRIFWTDRCEIQCGWDEPLRYFYLIVERIDTDDDDYLYSNLRRRNPAMNIDDVTETLRGLGIRPPATLSDDLARDMTRGDMGRYEYPAGTTHTRET
jgi:hypothetical protein